MEGRVSPDVVALIILALGKWMQENQEFIVVLGYTIHLQWAWDWLYEALSQNITTCTHITVIFSTPKGQYIHSHLIPFYPCTPHKGLSYSGQWTYFVSEIMQFPPKCISASFTCFNHTHPLNPNYILFLQGSSCQSSCVSPVLTTHYLPYCYKQHVRTCNIISV